MAVQWQEVRHSHACAAPIHQQYIQESPRVHSQSVKHPVSLCKHELQANQISSPNMLSPKKTSALVPRRAVFLQKGKRPGVFIKTPSAKLQINAHA